MDKKLGLTLSFLTLQALAQDNVELNSTIRSSNDRITGVIINESPSFRNSITLNKGNFTGIIWSDNDLRSRELIEYDLIGCYNKELFDKVNAFICYEKYTISGSENQSYLSGNISYDLEGINLNLHGKHYLDESGNVIKGSISKNFNFGDLNITSSASLVYSDDFFGTNGFSTYDVSLNGTYNLNENLSLTGAFKQQYSLNASFEDKLIGEIGINYRF